jgi:hypothetical protein
MDCWSDDEAFTCRKRLLLDPFGLAAGEIAGKLAASMRRQGYEAETIIGKGIEFDPEKSDLDSRIVCRCD